MVEGNVVVLVESDNISEEIEEILQMIEGGIKKREVEFIRKCIETCSSKGNIDSKTIFTGILRVDTSTGIEGVKEDLMEFVGVYDIDSLKLVASESCGVHPRKLRNLMEVLCLKEDIHIKIASKDAGKRRERKG